MQPERNGLEGGSQFALLTIHAIIHSHSFHVPVPPFQLDETANLAEGLPT